MHDIYKKRRIKDFRQSDIFVNDKEYAKLKRTYKSFRQHNDDIAREHNLLNQVQFNELKTVEERMQGHTIKDYQKDQLINLIDFEIFNHIKNKTICSSKSVDDSRLIDMLIELKDIYNRIEESYPTSFFQRSVQ